MILLLAVPAYGAIGAARDRIRLINGVTLFFVSHLVVFHQFATHGVRIGVAFFLWVGIFNLMAVAQFWAFANDLYTNERGERLFPLVGVGASLGAWIGARLASRLVGARRADAFAAGCGRWLAGVHRAYPVRQPSRAPAEQVVRQSPKRRTTRVGRRIPLGPRRPL